MGYCHVCQSAGSVNKYGFCQICGTEHQLSAGNLLPVMVMNLEKQEVRTPVGIQGG